MCMNKDLKRLFWKPLLRVKSCNCWKVAFHSFRLALSYIKKQREDKPSPHAHSYKSGHYAMILWPLFFVFFFCCIFLTTEGNEVNAFLAGDKQNKNQHTEKLRNWETEKRKRQPKVHKPSEIDIFQGRSPPPPPCWKPHNSSPFPCIRMLFPSFSFCSCALKKIIKLYINI